MRTHTEIHGERAVLHLHGRLGFEQRRTLLGAIKALGATSGVRHIDLDCSGITHVDSAGIALLQSICPPESKQAIPVQVVRLSKVLKLCQAFKML